MYFSIPTKLYNESGCVTRHADVFAGAGKKALLVTGRSSAEKTGARKHVTDALIALHIDWCIFSDIEENPSVETVLAAAEFGKKEEADFVIGIGGGSPLDASKAIALLMANPSCGREILFKKEALKHLPVFAVATTAGTGSEATPYAILTLHDAKTKRGIAHRIFPEAALTDPDYLAFAPVSVLCNTAVDAFGHLVESYFNNNASLYNHMACEYALKLWGSAAPALKELVQNGTVLSSDTYIALSNASTMAGMAISHTGTSIPHGLSYFLTYENNIPHGKAVGTFLVPYLRCCPDTASVSYFLGLMGLSSLEELEELLLVLIGQIKIARSDAGRYITSMLSNRAKLANCPYSVTEDILNQYYSNNKLVQLF